MKIRGQNLFARFGFEGHGEPVPTTFQYSLGDLWALGRELERRSIKGTHRYFSFTRRPEGLTGSLSLGSFGVSTVSLISRRSQNRIYPNTTNHMSNHPHLPHRFFGNLKKHVDDMDPLTAKKNLFLAGLIGFLFGPLGVGLYFMSWRDFLICLLVLVCLFICIPGLGALPGWLFSAAYGTYRAKKSNEYHA